MLAEQTTRRKVAIRRLRPAMMQVARLLDRLYDVIRAGGGRVSAVDYGGPSLIAWIPPRLVTQLASRSDVSRVEPAPVDTPMGALANETAAVGTSTWWANGYLGGTGPADTAPASIAIMDDKIQEDQPLFQGVNFERPQDAFVGTSCGQATAGCEHGTEVAGMAVAVGNSTCSTLCSSDSGQERGIAYGAAYVLDADTSAIPDSGVCLFDAGIWSFGVSQAPIGDCSHGLPGAAHPAAVHSDSHGSYTSTDDSFQPRNLDKFVSTYGGIVTEPSGNDGLNGTGSGHITDTCDAYNVICVGGISVNSPTTTSDDTIANFSSQGPSPGGRRKPDIVAIAAGGDSGNMTVVEQRYIANSRLERGDTGTSFASPQVAGGAALLYGAGLTDPLVVKSILLDSTTLGRATPASAMGTQVGWQPDWGWGELNLDSAYKERNNFASDGVGAQDVRFYRATATAGDRATLVWNRRVVGPLVQTIPPQTLTLSNLDLYQYDASQSEQAASTSTIDNVEQVRATQTGTVVYKVKDQSTTVDGLPSEPFALAAKNLLTPLAAPKPSVTLTVDRRHVRQGEPVTVTQTVTNSSGDLAASNATATLTLPTGVSVVSGGSTTWSPGGGTLAAGASSSHQWTVTGTADGLEQLSATAQDTAYDETFSASANEAIRVDSTPPAPALICPASGTSASLALAWTASDASPIAAYDIDVSTDGGPFTSWRTGLVDTSGTFGGQPGHSYGFRLRATDDLGNSSDFITCGPISIGFAPTAPIPFTPAPTPALPLSSHLRLTAIRVRHGRLLITGRLASTAKGSITATYKAHHHRPVHARTWVRSGAYRLSLRVPTRRGLLTLRYSGDRTFAPQHISRRIR